MNGGKEVVDAVQAGKDGALQILSDFRKELIISVDLPIDLIPKTLTNKIFKLMANLNSNFLGIKSPNPYWLASAPPTDKKINVFGHLKQAGVELYGKHWLAGEECFLRYSAVNFNGTRVMGFNNIELISDRPLDIES